MTIGIEKATARSKDRFERLYIPEPNSGCWLWLGHLRETEGRLRGEMSFQGRSQLVNRVAWKLFRGAIPTKSFVLHTCDVSICVNPDHLYLGTHLDNMRDMRVRRRSFMATNPLRCTAALQKGKQKNIGHRRLCGERHWNAKITQEQVEKIKNDPRSFAAIAAAHGVWPTTIRDIKSGRTWKRPT